MFFLDLFLNMLQVGYLSLLCEDLSWSLSCIALLYSCIVRFKWQVVLLVVCIAARAWYGYCFVGVVPRGLSVIPSTGVCRKSSIVPCWLSLVVRVRETSSLCWNIGLSFSIMTDRWCLDPLKNQRNALLVVSYHLCKCDIL